MDKIIDWFISNSAVAILSFFVGTALSWIISNKNIFKIGFDSIIHWNQEYRMSISYLFKIKIKIDNSNFPHQKWDSHLEKSIL